MRNLMAPIELRDGTTIPEAVQQAQDVFGVVPSPNIDALTLQSQRLLACIDEKLRPIDRSLSPSLSLSLRLHMAFLSRNPNLNRVLNHHRMFYRGLWYVCLRSETLRTSPISWRCEEKECVLKFTTLEP